MRRLATFVMAGQWQAVTSVVGFALLAFVFPPLIVFSGGALALVTLRVGAGAGVTVLVAASVVIAALIALLTGQLWVGVLFALLQWAPVVPLALVLRYTASLGTSLAAAIGLGLSGLLLLYALAPDLTPYWRELLEALLKAPLQDSGLSAGDVGQVLDNAVQVMTGSVIASMLVVYTLSLFTGRWWQAVLYNPGGFGREFRALRLGRPAAAMALLLFAGAVVSDAHQATELAMVGLSLFFLQGLAVLHELSRRTDRPMLWLGAAYVVLVLALPQMLAVLTALGVLDNLVDLRARLGGPQAND